MLCPLSYEDIVASLLRVNQSILKLAREQALLTPGASEVAEAGGFEPPTPFSGEPILKIGALNRSATPPNGVPGVDRTPNLQLRKLTLCPVELRGPDASFQNNREGRFGQRVRCEERSLQPDFLGGFPEGPP